MVTFDKLIQPIWEVSPYPIAVIGFDRDPGRRKFAYVNPAFTALTGYTSAEAVDRPATLLNGPKTSIAAIEEREAAVSQGRPSEIALVHYRKDGSEYVARMTVAPLVEPDGSPQFLIWIETAIPASESAAAGEAATQHAVVVPLTLPMPLKEFAPGALPKHLTSHPDLDALRALWARLCGDRLLPRRQDFSLSVVKRWASHLSIVTVIPGGRFQFRLFGTELGRVYGRDLTGRFLDELTPRDLWSLMILHYQEVVETRQPLFAPVSIANGRWYNEVSRLLLPLAAEQDGVSFIMGADYARTIY